MTDENVGEQRTSKISNNNRYRSSRSMGIGQFREPGELFDFLLFDPRLPRPFFDDFWAATLRCLYKLHNISDPSLSFLNLMMKAGRSTLRREDVLVLISL